MKTEVAAALVHSVKIAPSRAAPSAYRYRAPVNVAAARRKNHQPGGCSEWWFTDIHSWKWSPGGSP